MTRVLRRILLAGVASLVISGGCIGGDSDGDDPSQGLEVTISSAIPVDSVEVRYRDITYATETLIVDVARRDLAADPLSMVIVPGEVVPAGSVFVQAIGSLAGSEVARAAVLTELPADGLRQVSLILSDSFADQDGDGFESCGDVGCDCNDSAAEINPFTVEACGDLVDNNCSGWPIDEGCPCNVSDALVACTLLSSDLAHLAGIGACTLGSLACLDDGDGDEFGALETDCAASGAGTFGVEVSTNAIDDDCDGTVNEGAACTVGEFRSCFLGLIGSAAVDRVPVGSECSLGTQSCDASGRWGGCEGEVRPQRAPSGIGWSELPAIGMDPGQCDGLDNDCDGEFDEEPYFDADGDGYTICGTDPVNGGTSATLIDCDDGDANANPGNAGSCP